MGELSHWIAIVGNLDQIPKHVGDHLWTWTAVFRAAPGNQSPVLDSDDLLRVEGIACLYCAQEYTFRTAHRLCPGYVR
jgi:hypothetical protein